MDKAMTHSLPISVLMPVFNAEKYLREAIESILYQTFADFEFIIINDGSTDGSKDIILSYSDSRIKYVENESNLGVVKTANRGIDLCCGKYMFRMDADDISSPLRLEKQYRFMERHPEIGVCGSWARVIDKNGGITGKIIQQTRPEFIRIHLLFSVPLMQPSCCIRTSILKENPYRKEPVTEDYELWCRLNDCTRMANLPEFLLQYRWHETNISKEKELIRYQNKKQIMAGELQKLHLYPNDAEMRIHTLSFSLYDFKQTIEESPIQLADLHDTEKWFEQLLAANKQWKPYNRSAFIAFLWSRWMVLCLKLNKKTKMLCPSFADFRPKVLFYLFQQIGLLFKKQ
jgi:glycosyltransferase involved in cell wall biosynthesis